MFIAELLIIAKTWKKSKYPLTEEWTKKMWYVYTVEYYSAIKSEIMIFVTTWMDLKITILSEVNHRERQVPYDIPYIWNLKMIQMNLFTKEKQTLRNRK